jgi:hypothetical protein
MFGNFTKSGFSVFGQALESLGNIVAPIDENENENEKNKEDENEDEEEDNTILKASSQETSNENENEDSGGFDNVILQYIQQKREEQSVKKPKLEKKLIHKSEVNTSSTSDNVSPIPFIPVASKLEPQSPNSMVEIALDDDRSSSSEGVYSSKNELHDQSHFTENEYPVKTERSFSDASIGESRRDSVSSVSSGENYEYTPWNQPHYQQSSHQKSPTSLKSSSRSQQQPSLLPTFSSEELEKKIQLKYRENLENKYRQLETRYLELQNENQLNLLKLSALTNQENQSSANTPFDSHGGTTISSLALTTLQNQVKEYEKMIGNLKITIHSLQNENDLKDKKMKECKELLEIKQQELVKLQQSSVHSTSSTTSSSSTSFNPLESSQQENQKEKEKTEDLLKENQLLLLNNQDLLNKFQEKVLQYQQIFSQYQYQKNEIIDIKHQLSFEKQLVIESEQLQQKNIDLIKQLKEEKAQLLMNYKDKEEKLLYENSLLEKVIEENEQMNEKYEKLLENNRLESIEIMNNLKSVEEKYLLLEKNYSLLQEEYHHHLNNCKHQQQQQQQQQQPPLQPQGKNGESNHVETTDENGTIVKKEMEEEMKQENDHLLSNKIIMNYVSSLIEKINSFCLEYGYDNPFPSSSLSSSQSSSLSPSKRQQQQQQQQEEMKLQYLYNSFQLFIQLLEKQKNDFQNSQNQMVSLIQFLQKSIVSAFPELSVQVQQLISGDKGISSSLSLILDLMQLYDKSFATYQVCLVPCRVWVFYLIHFCRKERKEIKRY